MLEQPRTILLKKCSVVIFLSNVFETINVVMGHTNNVHATFRQGRFFLIGNSAVILYGGVKKRPKTKNSVSFMNGPKMRPRP